MAAVWASVMISHLHCGWLLLF